jgi:hypothetical protein
MATVWIWLVGRLVPADERRDWVEEWRGELATRGGSMTHAWGALSDGRMLRTGPPWARTSAAQHLSEMVAMSDESPIRGPAQPAAFVLTCLATTLLAGCALPADEWTPLFNGTDLTGWTVKIRGSELGEDPYDTFRVEGGLLTVGYEGYDLFEERFGHIFYEAPFSQYELRIEYRFVGSQVGDGPAWAFKNSGVMIHGQSPESMLRDQDFPISIEAQFLGGNGTEDRPTANLCTPGTHVEIDAVLTETHCISSTSGTYHGEEWVTVDLIVRGYSTIHHLVDGDTVLAYSRPVIGGGVVDGYDPAAKVDGTSLTGGYIALQSESHPIQFRRILIRELSPRSP